MNEAPYLHTQELEPNSISVPERGPLAKFVASGAELNWSAAAARRKRTLALYRPLCASCQTIA